MGRMSKILDAFKAAPAGAPAPPLYGLGEAIGRRISNRAAQRYSESYGGRDAIDFVMECVNLYARTASHAEFYFKRGDTRLVENPRAPQYKGRGYGTADADLVELFDHPNRTDDYTAILELSVIDLLLTGEFFWVKNIINGLGRPQELYRVPPHRMDVIPGDIAPEGYKYTPPGGEEIEFKTDEVIHVKLPNPHDPWRGLGVIAGNPGLFDTALSLDDSIRDYYERGTRLSGVVESERPMPDTSWEKFKRQFSNMYSGRGNQWAVAFLQRAKFTPTSANAQDAGFDKAQVAVRDRIAALFSVPTPLLGDVGGSTDRQAVREAQRIWDNKIFRPFLDSLQSRISAQLTQPAWGVDFCIEYEYTMPAEDRLALGQAMMATPVLVREVREQMGLEPLGDERDDKIAADVVAPAPASKPGEPIPPTGKTSLSGTAPYPAGAAGRTGEPTTASKAWDDPATELRAMLGRMRGED